MSITWKMCWRCMCSHTIHGDRTSRRMRFRGLRYQNQSSPSDKLAGRSPPVYHRCLNLNLNVSGRDGLKGLRQRLNPARDLLGRGVFHG